MFATTTPRIRSRVLEGEVDSVRSFAEYAPPERPVCFVTDDHPVVLNAICGFLEGHGMEIAGRALDGHDALAKIETRKPQVAVFDLGLPGLDGIEAARIVASVSPETAVVIYTGEGNITRAVEALEAGVRGVVLKDAPLDDLVRAIKVAVDGGLYLDPTLAASLVESDEAQLTERERTVLRLAADGLTSKQIGRRVYLSEQTVARNLTNAMRKLDAATRTEAVAVALRRRIIS